MHLKKVFIDALKIDQNQLTKEEEAIDMNDF